MAFLDNSGDIILDAVLTDTGRMRLAKGDGSFRISKFALGDDEIDYSLYNNSSPSGTAYYDLEILQTPVLEAFSNNASSMKSLLISLARNDLLYLPVIKVNTRTTNYNAATDLIKNGYVLTTDEQTEKWFDANVVKYNGAQPVESSGLFYGFGSKNTKIQLDQGIDNPIKPKNSAIDPDLKETQYMIVVDNRLVSIKDKNDVSLTPSYIDDDNMATYYVSDGVDTSIFDTTYGATSESEIAGSRGTRIDFKLKSQNEIQSSTYLFDTLGKDLSSGFGLSTNYMKGILTNIRVMGVTTGYSIDIPLMVIRKIV